VEQVLDQLDTLSDASTENYLGDERVLDEVERTCFAVYTFLQAKAAASSVHRRGLEEALAGRYFVLAHGRFLSPKQLAFELAAPACAPYLYAVPDTYRRRYPALLRLAGVRDRFDAGDFVLALQVEFNGLVRPVVVGVVTIWSMVNTTARRRGRALMRDATKCRLYTATQRLS